MEDQKAALLKEVTTHREILRRLREAHLQVKVEEEKGRSMMRRETTENLFGLMSDLQAIETSNEELNDAEIQYIVQLEKQMDEKELATK